MALQKLFVVVFVLANLILPFAIGELFPFTTAPMFRDQPRSYCEFAVFSPAGQALPLETFGLQRNYDGNPVGYGSGRLPGDSLDRFGDDQQLEQIVPTPEEMREWISTRLVGTNYAYVTVKVKVWGPVGKRIDLLDDSYEIVVPRDPNLQIEPTDESEEYVGEASGKAESST